VHVAGTAGRANEFAATTAPSPPSRTARRTSVRTTGLPRRWPCRWSPRRRTVCRC